MGSALTKVVTGLHIGSLAIENEFESMVKFTHLLTVIPNDEKPNFTSPNNFVRKCIIYNENDPVSLLKQFPEAISFIAETRFSGSNNILVNSHAGSMVNIAVVIAYLVTEFQQLSMDKAILLMQNKAAENFVLDDWVFKQLEEFETPGKHPEISSPGLPSICDQRVTFNNLVSSNQMMHESWQTNSLLDWAELETLVDSIDGSRKIAIVRRRNTTQNSDSHSHSNHSSMVSFSLGAGKADSGFANNDSAIFKALNKRLATGAPNDDDLFDFNDFAAGDDHSSTEELDDDDIEKAMMEHEETAVTGSMDIPVPARTSLIIASSFMPQRAQPSVDEQNVERGLDAASLLSDSAFQQFQYSSTAPVVRTFFR